MSNKTFSALIVDKIANQFSVEIKKLAIKQLPQEEVLIKVLYSSINYKDALACVPDGKIVKAYPFIPGIDLAGIVVSSKDARFKEGDSVLATGYELGVSHFGGYSEYAALPGDWLIPLPQRLTLKESMIFGTAGFTAALSIHRLEENGLTPNNGKVLVTGATGGVGSLAVTMLSNLGYHVVASTGKTEEHDLLRALGASEIISRSDVYDGTIKSLDKQQFAAAIDPVGGSQLAAILSKISYGGSVAVSGLTGGAKVPTSVFPFILRGINLLGVDSVYCPSGKRSIIWQRIAAEMKDEKKLNLIKREILFRELPDALPQLLKGKSVGRIIIKISA